MRRRRGTSFNVPVPHLGPHHTKRLLKALGVQARHSCAECLADHQIADHGSICQTHSKSSLGTSFFVSLKHHVDCVLLGLLRRFGRNKHTFATNLLARPRATAAGRPQRGARCARWRRARPVQLPLVPLVPSKALPSTCRAEWLGFRNGRTL